MSTDNPIIVLAASVGGLKAITKILSQLPKDFPAPIAIVQHLAPRYPSRIAEILSWHTPLKVKEVEGGEELTSGIVYIAPPDNHLVVNANGILSLSKTEKVHYVRPAGDVLFQSAAAIFLTKVIAVVLTGKDSDGASGVQAVKQMGGTVIAQDEETSESYSMPQAAIKTGAVDFILPLDEIAPTLLKLVEKGTISKL